MAATLYTADILRLATNIPHLGRLNDAEGTAEKRSPVCGSQVVIDVILDDAGNVAALGQEVQACALGQASAAIMAQAAVGQSAEELTEVSQALTAYLAGEGACPANWPELAIFAAAIPHSARHPSIRLPFEAVAEAAAQANLAERQRA